MKKLISLPKHQPIVIDTDEWVIMAEAQVSDLSDIYTGSHNSADPPTEKAVASVVVYAPKDESKSWPLIVSASSDYYIEDKLQPELCFNLGDVLNQFELTANQTAQTGLRVCDSIHAVCDKLSELVGSAGDLMWLRLATKCCDNMPPIPVSPVDSM